VQVIESEEESYLKVTQDMVAKKETKEIQKLRKEAEEKVSYGSMPPMLAKKLSNQAKLKAEFDANFAHELMRNKSQRITRLTVMRDTVAKSLINQLLQNEAPREYTSKAYLLRLGRTTDMSRVVDDFKFSDPRFKVPFDSPIEATPDNNVTGFAFVHVVYKQNVYSWSETNPPSPDFMLMTLIVMKANTDDLEQRHMTEGYPIRMFANYQLMSNALCVYWDRFAPGTAGGAWSRQGIRNDAEGCITSHLSDVGIFMDGALPKASPMVEAALTSEREGFLKTCIGCDGSFNMAVVAVLAMIIFTCTLLIMLGFVMDETARTNMIKNNIKSRYLLDGDGITGALNVNDPIAYKYAGEKPIRLVVGTFWNMIKREHALIGTVYYHELFTRPQRMQCLLSLIAGLLAFNASMQSNPGYITETRTFFVPGILSGLVLYPVYCGLLLMFNMRPKAVKKKLIKRGAQLKELENLRAQRDALGAKTALMPKPGYALREPPSSSWPGATTVLNLAAPLPLPPLPHGMAGGTMGAASLGALPPMPPGMGASAGGMAGMGGMLALPALPGRSAQLPLPPPPSYAPPPKNAAVLPVPGMPPNVFPKQGPPPVPFPQLPAPSPGPGPTLLPPNNAALLDGSLGGTNRPGLYGAFDVPALELPGPSADTGGTTMQLSDGQAQPMPAGNAIAFAPEQNLAMTADATCASNEVEATPQPPGVLAEDAVHGMMMQPGTPVERTPPGTPGGGSGGAPIASGPPTPLGPEGAGKGTLPRSLGGSERSVHTPGFANTGGTTPPGTPPSQLVYPGAGIGSMMPSAFPKQQGNLRLAPQHQLVPQGDGPMPLFVRAQPPPMMPAPFNPTPAGPLGAVMWKMPGLPPSGMAPPIPSAKGSGPAGIPMPLVPPPPPPPPREADQQFVRRIQYTYLDKVMREHQKFDMLEDPDELGKQTPGWVYDSMTLMPYLACMTSTLAAIFLVLQYGVKFQEWQEQYWLYGSMLGFCLDLSLLEIFRMLMLTLVELRKYENRKKSKAGVFLPRRVPGGLGEKRQIAPQEKLYKRATAKPDVPRGKIAPNPLPAPRPLGPPPAPGAPGGISSIVGPPPPPKFSSAAMGMAGTGSMNFPSLPPQGSRGQSPRSGTGSGRFNFQATPPGSKPGSRGASPRNTPPGNTPPGNVSPAHSLQGMKQSLNTAVSNGAGRYETQPPPPQAGKSPAGFSGAAPPPPADVRPNFSRPSSANSGSSAARRAAAAKAGARPPD